MTKFVNGIVVARVWDKWYYLIQDLNGTYWSEPYSSEKELMAAIS